MLPHTHKQTDYLTKVAKNITHFSILLGLNFLAVSVFIQPAFSAEKIRLVYGPLNCTLSVDALATYAKTGEITPEFSFYARFLDEKTLVQLRHWLQKRFHVDHVSLYRFFHAPKGETLLTELGEAIQTHSERNGFYALRSALVGAAANPQGWTIIDAIREFPTEHLQIDTGQLFKLNKFWQESVEATQSNPNHGG
ncbi:alpha/beta hydrolase [Pleurocapsales cyanobacterium LEGE 06147]|nr:alpha/beta hydrolase [Pleurocapsales cyanobacterium LEGE 06147]